MIMYGGKLNDGECSYCVLNCSLKGSLVCFCKLLEL